jgi:hypothetical protein
MAYAPTSPNRTVYAQTFGLTPPPPTVCLNVMCNVQKCKQYE